MREKKWLRCQRRSEHLRVAFVICVFFPPPGSLGAQRPLFPLTDQGTEVVVDYEKYGVFSGRGSSKYHYEIKDREGLAKAVGAGIFPNSTSLEKEPGFQEINARGELDGNLEQYQPLIKPELTFYKWGSMKGLPYKALRLFMMASALERGGHPKHALKAYYAIVVHYPRDIVYQAGKPWYVGVSALDAVDRLLEENPEWKLQLEDASIHVENQFDRKVTNDVFAIDPGRWKAKESPPLKKEEWTLTKRTIGHGSTQLVKSSRGHWRLLVDGKPYLIRGISYSPTPVGKSPDFGGYRPHQDWMFSDENKNGQLDGPYDAWVDLNKNNRRDSGESPVGDFSLFHEMGVNTLRLYHHGGNSRLFGDLSKRFGIRVLMGDFLGSYALGSGASWQEGTDYSDPEQRDRMRRSVRKMVLENRDQNYVLLWVLGNENNYGIGNNADKIPKIYYKFVNSIARMIHIYDPERPVALCNGGLEHLDLIKELCPDIDLLAVNSYRGSEGMGESFWESLKEVWGKPVLISEFGCPAYVRGFSPEKSEEIQATYLLKNWRDIVHHSAGYKTGNALGGVVFEWLDEWWKAGPATAAYTHDETAQSKGAFADGNLYEEWMGIVSQGDGEKSPFIRQLRKAYFEFKDGPWKSPMRFPPPKSREARGREATP